MASPGTDQAASQVEAAIASSQGKVDSHVHDEINATILANGVNTPEAMNDLQSKLNPWLPSIVLEDAGVKNLLAADGGISREDTAGLATNSDGQDQLAAAALEANFDNIDTNHDLNVTEAELNTWKTGIGQRTDSQPSGTLDMQSWLGPQNSETVFMRDFYTGQLTQINGITNGAMYYPDNNGQWLDSLTGAKITTPQMIDFDGYQFGQFSFQYQDGPLAGATVVHKTDNSEVTTAANGQVQQVRYPNGDIRTFTYGADGSLTTVVMKPKSGDTTTTDVSGKQGTVLADGTLMLDSDDGQMKRIIVTSGEEHTVAKTTSSPQSEGESDEPAPDEAEGDQSDDQATRVDPNQEVSQTTLPDGSIVHLNANGQPLKVEHNGAVTTFEYDSEGKVYKITPPAGINSPLHREGDKWDSQGTPVEVTNMEVRTDGSYTYHWKDSSGEYDITNKIDGSQLYFQNGKLLQVDFPNKPRGVVFDNAENPTEVKINDGSKTYVKTDSGWVNKDDANDKFVSITPAADGTVTFKRADNSQVIYHTDGTTKEVAGDAPPVSQDDQIDYNKEVKVVTAPDGTLIHVNSEGQPLKVEHNGAVTTFEYDSEGKVYKITPPAGSINSPLHREGDKWDSQGTPVEVSNMEVRTDGSYTYHWKDSSGEYDITNKTDGSQLYFQNGKLLQVDFPNKPRGVVFDNAENPTEVKINDGSKTYVKTDSGWVNKDDANDKFVSITPAADGTVTFKRADNSQIIYHTDGTTKEVAGDAPPVNLDDQIDYNKEVKVVTAPDGTLIHVNSEGQPLKVEHNGAVTTFEYDSEGKVNKITPPAGTIGPPLHREGDKWDSQGTPIELTNMKVNADGSYTYHGKDSRGEYDIKMKPDGSRIFSQNGKVLQIDFPTKPRGVEIDNPENPTQIQANGKTYTKTDAGWVNKDDANDKFTSITAGLDGTVTFTRADKSQVLLRSDGTTQDIAAPTDNGNNNGNGDQTTTQTLPDGSIVIKDSQGRVVETKGKDGSNTKYTYNNKGLSGVTRTWDNNPSYSEHYRHNADGTWTKTSRVQHMPSEDTSERIDKVEVDPTTGALKTTIGEVVHIEQVNGDDTYTRGKTTVEVKKNEKGEYQSITTTIDGKVVEALSKEGDKWVRTGPNGDKMEVTSVSPDGKGGYSYRFATQSGDIKVTRNLDNSQKIDLQYKNGNTRTDNIDSNNKLVKTVNTDSSVNPPLVEEFTYGADGQPTGVKVYPKAHREEAKNATDVKVENNSISYTLGEGENAVRVTVNADGSRVEGKLLADGTRQVTRVLHKEGDYFQFEYDEQGKIAKVTQVFPANSKNADGSSPRTTETWAPDSEHPGMYKRSSDGMPGRDLSVDSNGNFSYTYTSQDGSLHRHTEVATGQNPPDTDVQGDVTFGDRTFKVGEDGNYNYDIKSGDTLWWIASNILSSQGVENPSNKQIWEVIKKVAQENGIQNVDLIYTGDQLRISKEIMNHYKPQTPPPDSNENGDGTDNYQYN